MCKPLSHAQTLGGLGGGLCSTGQESGFLIMLRRNSVLAVESIDTDSVGRRVLITVKVADTFFKFTSH